MVEALSLKGHAGALRLGLCDLLLGTADTGAVGYGVKHHAVCQPIGS